MPHRASVAARAAGLGSALLAAALGAAPARADLLLNEVLYDPDGADEGREFVELWNPDPAPRPLAGVRIEAGDGARPDAWTVVWAGGAAESVRAGAPFLVSGASLAGALQNGPDAVRLTRDGALLDLLGYGDLEWPALYLGAPAPDAPSGQSLARLRDGAGSGVNRDDWAPEPSPTPGRANHPDVRLTLTSRRLTIAPEVPWPGDPVLVTARVRNDGRLPLEAHQWGVALDRLRWPRDPAAEGAPSLPLSSAAGLPLAPSDSTEVSAWIAAPAAAGPFLVRAVAAAFGSGAGGAGESGPVSTDTSLAPARAAAGPAVVNEFAFRGAAGEWVEVALLAAIDDWGALSLSDRSGRGLAVDRGSSPRAGRAGDLLVLAEDPAAVRSRVALPESLVLGRRGAWPALHDEEGPDGNADVVRITGSDGVPCDAVPYGGSWAERGGSVERLAPDLPSASRGSWGESLDPSGGTPGRPNSLRAPGGAARPRGALLAAPGRRLLRAAGAVIVPVALRLTEEARGRRLRIDVRDLAGRSRRRLADGQRFGGAAAFLWDGRDDGGIAVPPGIYVVRAEADAEGSLPARSTSLSLLVADGGAR